MFFIFATKPLNDRTQGFRFNFLGIKGLTRKRKSGSRGWFNVSRGECMTGYHLGKRTVYFEHKRNRSTKRRLFHYAG
jgi:hypothetical protein